MGAHCSQFEKEFLAAHNEYRRLHNVPPLRLSRMLCNHAQAWATIIAAKNVMQHNPESRYGENIYWANGKTITATDAVKAWYDEIKDYNFQRGDFSASTGHFTQVVWRESQEVGVGVVTKGSSIWIVANYNPAGNVMNNFQKNVSAPLR